MEGVSVVGRMWKFARSTGIAHHLVLLVFPLFGRPAHFLPGPQRKGYATARYGYALPFAAAGVWMLAAGLFFDAVAPPLISRLVDLFGEVGAYRRLNLLRRIASWETFGLVVFFIAAFSVARYAYYRLARIFLMKLGKDLELFPHKYFLVSTSSAAFLYGVSGLLVAVLYRYAEEYESVVSEAIKSPWILVVPITLAVAQWRGLANRSAAQVDLYGSSGVALCIDLMALVLAIAVLYTMLLVVGG